MMDHDLFFPSTTEKDVKFSVIKAKGKISFPDQEWSPEKFVLSFKIINLFTSDLKALSKEIDKNSLVRALMMSQKPPCPQKRHARQPLQIPRPTKLYLILIQILFPPIAK